MKDVLNFYLDKDAHLILETEDDFFRQGGCQSSRTWEPVDEDQVDKKEPE